MQLVSFRIKECFGFRDSDRIDLQGPTNLIYVLGRNSSGKTSFLTALAYFSPHLKPGSYTNFTNFNPSPQEPSLLAEYSVRTSDFTLEAFIKVLHAEMDRSNQGSNVTFLSKEYQRYKEELTKKLLPLYKSLFEGSIAQGTCWVQRNTAGDYYFSAEPDFKAAHERNKQLVDFLPSLPQQLGLSINVNGQLNINGNWQQFTQIPANEIENLLVKQLPIITWFKEAYTLLDVLPNVIKVEHLTNSPNRLTTVLIEYLGKDKLGRLLKGQHPREQREILKELQEKIDVFIKEVNESREPGTALLAIDLYQVDGLQVTMMADNKPSFYRHLSDTTKLLFAYHLYTRIRKLVGNIFLFDEPNNGFHATSQELLLRFLRGLGAKGNLVVVSTHSEHLIDPDYLGGIRLMNADTEGYLRVRNKWNAQTNGLGDFLALRPILDAIGLRYGMHHLTIRDKVIVTEGVTELMYLQAFRQLLGYECELHLAPTTGDETILPVVALLISQGLCFKVVVDTTLHGKSVKVKLQEAYEIPDSAIYEVEIPSRFPQTPGSGIEDVFSKKDFAKLLANTAHVPEPDFETLANSQYMRRKTVVPKRVVAYEFNKRIANFSESDFEEETLANMRLLLDFCENDAWFFPIYPS
jgi:predicted ATP-dependent endonuclease of OLD family